MKHLLLTFLFILLFSVAAIAKVNINTANIKELSTLPGIGTKKAEAIVKDREQIGKFTTIEDLVRVKGIGEKLLMKFKDQITVGK